MFFYKIATNDDLEKIWNKNIINHLNDDRWKRWKDEYIMYNKSGMAKTFVVSNDDDPVGEITILFSPECKAVKNKNLLCNGKDIANFNAFRIEKQFENQGHISKLVKLAENFARENGIKTLTIGAEAKECRNLSIYFHFGFTKFVMSEIDGGLILYYSKQI